MSSLMDDMDSTDKVDELDEKQFVPDPRFEHLKNLAPNIMVKAYSQPNSDHPQRAFASIDSEADRKFFDLTNNTARVPWWTKVLLWFTTAHYYIDGHKDGHHDVTMGVKKLFGVTYAVEIKRGR